MITWLTTTSSNSIYVIYCIIVSTTVLNAKKDVADKISVRIYRNGNSSQFEEFPSHDGVQVLEKSSDFDRDKPLVLVIHGVQQGANKRLIRAVVDSFGTSGKSKSYNILALHLPTLFKTSWKNTYLFGVIGTAKVVGRIVGDFLRDMIRKGLTHPSRINIIGYSLGAQVAGYAARQVRQEFQTPVEYITGLDPAGPGFSFPFRLISGMKHVTSQDARIVHLFHTNSYYYASAAHLGTADFIFNGGLLQPGCFSETAREGCSHARAIWYFAEAVVNGEAFVALRCSSNVAFATCLCNGNENKTVSFPPDYSASGKYYVRTRDHSPYGMGAPGAACAKGTFWTWLWSIFNITPS